MGEPARDLVERTFEFAAAVRRLVNHLPRSVANYEDVGQLVRSSGSVAANYLEATFWRWGRDRLVREAEELKRIFSSIAGKDDTGEPQ